MMSCVALTSLWAATALQFGQALCRRRWVVASCLIVAAKPSAIAERNVVRAGDALVAPRHVC